MASLNKCFLLGNLVRDVELKYLPSGACVANFSLAVNEKVKSGGEYKDEVSFFDIVAFGKTGELVAEYVRKGSSVLITARAKQDRWEDGGNKRSKVKFIAENVQFLGGKKEKQVTEDEYNEQDSIPF